MDKLYFVLKLIPPRPTFHKDMNLEERAIMTKHIAYWDVLMQKGFVVALGPVLDPSGTYGLGIVEVDNEEQVKEFIKNDPASQLSHYEMYPMHAKVRK
jgi:uncharacterized protein